MSNLVPANFGAVSTKFQNMKTENDLASGIAAGFGLIGYKGKVWSLRHRGEEQTLLRDDGDGPRNSIEVVILKGAPYISKIWYEKGYVEGSTAAPDCFSPNGVVPDPQSAKPQCHSCAACPQNVWGSKLTEAGKKGKACSDSKRLAVVPLGDLRNEAFGGPLLLRVPAASLQDLATYGNKMQNLGYPYFAIGTRISFDVNEAYPKFLFQAIRPLTDSEADIVLELQNMQEVSRVLAEGAEHTAGPAPDPVTVQNAFEQPPVTPKATAGTANGSGATANGAAAAKAAPQTAPKQEPKPEPKPAAKATGFGATAPAKPAEQQQEVASAPAQKANGARPAPVIPDEDETSADVSASAEDVGGEEPAAQPTGIELSLDEQLENLLGQG